MNKLFRGALLAGACISIGAIANLQTGGVIGAVLFSVGLIACVSFKLPLYTGTAGFVNNGDEMRKLGVILFGNIIGCFIVASLTRYSLPALPIETLPIVTKRIGYNVIQSLILGLFCGFLMTLAVHFARKGSFIPLLFAVPVFILSGFLHSIADAFYFCVAPVDFLAQNTQVVIANYIFVVIGNFIGCNLYRITYWRLEY